VINPASLRLTYAYDAASQRNYLIDPEPARFTYVFDAAGRTSYVANPQGQRATWSYDAASRVTGIHFANTTRASYLYDNANRLLRVANVSSPSTTLSSFSYALDAVGNRLRVVESSGNRVTWSYDNTYQLKNEQRSGSNSYNITYTYDPVGNRLVLINGGVATTNTYNAANELTKSQAAAGVTTTTYDANGNLLLSTNPSNQRTTNTWDFENRLTQVSLPSAIVDIFTYNGDGQRVQKQDSTGVTKHVRDGQNILLETNSSNIIQVVYTLQPFLYGNLISQIRSGTTSFYLFDGLGSAAQLASSTGSVTDSYLYDSFGNILLTSGSTTNWFRYVGELGYYYDVDLAQYYLRARYYNPSIQRFLSRDPIAVSGISNFYAYVENNPLLSTDPSGLQTPMKPPQRPAPVPPPPSTPSRPPTSDTPMMGPRGPRILPIRPGEPPRQTRPDPPNAIGTWINYFGWGYGWYCGLFRKGRPIGASPSSCPQNPPIDFLDKACKQHDRCLATPGEFFNPLRQLQCDFNLCQNAIIASSSGCATSYPTSDPWDLFNYLQCRQAASDVQKLYCTLSGGWGTTVPITTPPTLIPSPYPEANLP